MNDFLSLRYLLSLLGVANGVASLDQQGKVFENQLPTAAFGAFVGDYSSLSALQTAHVTGASGQYGTIGGTKYYWNSAMTPPGWTNVEINITNYNALTDAQKSGQSEWLIVPDN